MTHGNLYEDADVPVGGERFDTLLQHRNLVVERIVSASGMTPTEFVQEQDEWVLLVRGTATLDIDGREATLVAGDHLFLPAHTPHTVTQVSDGAMWLAVHLHPAPTAPVVTGLAPTVPAVTGLAPTVPVVTGLAPTAPDATRQAPR